MRGELTSIENIGYFLLSLFFVEDEELVSIRNVNSVRSVAHVCVFPWWDFKERKIARRSPAISAGHGGRFLRGMTIPTPSSTFFAMDPRYCLFLPRLKVVVGSFCAWE